MNYQTDAKKLWASLGFTGLFVKEKWRNLIGKMQGISRELSMRIIVNLIWVIELCTFVSYGRRGIESDNP